MDIQYNPPPNPNGKLPKPFTTRILSEFKRRAGDWLFIPLIEIAGKDNRARQKSIIDAARYHGYRVQTTMQDGRLYIRLLGDLLAATESSQEPTSGKKGLK